MMAKNPFQGDDVDPFSGVRDEDGGIKKDAPEVKAEAPKAEAPKAEAPKKQSFAQAFAAARKAGDKTFMFNGKSFSTKLASDKPKAPAAPAERVGPTKARAANLPPLPKAEAPKPAAKQSPVRAEMSRNTAANAKANRERMEAQRKAREERKKKSEESKPLFGRNPAGKTPAEFRKEKGFAKGGSVKGAGIEKRGMRKCKIC
jgi:hypothetical protein